MIWAYVLIRDTPPPTEVAWLPLTTTPLSSSELRLSMPPPEDALPLLAKIQQQGRDMKEADIFESWINNLAEGTWSLPETPEQLNQLKELMSLELLPDQYLKYLKI